MSIFSFTFFVGCSEDENVNEYEVLLEYLEDANYMNTAESPSIKSASFVQTNINTGVSQYLIDIRSEADYNDGHIEGAVNVAFSSLLTHMESINSDDYEYIIIICYSGQSAAYGTCMLRLLGYDNVYSMLFGMSSWGDSFAADYWSKVISTGNQYSSDFVTTATPIGETVSPPKLDTGKKKGRDILKARVKELLSLGFSGQATISASMAVPNHDDYYIINYWPTDHYNMGHIPGAYNYIPRTDLQSSTNLDKIPADETVVVYCYTGQNSAYVTAFLKILGYDAKSLVYGTNSMIYDTMPGTKFSQDAIMNYPVVTTP